MGFLNWFKEYGNDLGNSNQYFKWYCDCLAG